MLWKEEILTKQNRG